MFFSQLIDLAIAKMVIFMSCIVYNRLKNEI